MSDNLLKLYKVYAAQIANGLTHAQPEKRMPMAQAVDHILRNRITKGARAALLSGLVVGALVERGHPDIAENVTIAIADRDVRA